MQVDCLFGEISTNVPLKLNEKLQISFPNLTYASHMPPIPPIQVHPTI